MAVTGPSSSILSYVNIHMTGDIWDLTNTGSYQAVGNDDVYWMNGGSNLLGDLTESTDQNGATVYEICFLSGSMIEAPAGARAVEDLVMGDDVVTYSEGAPSTRRVTWAGQAHCTVRPELPKDEAGYPVRVLKDAIADGVPFRDLLITAEHCLFFDGKFVPARMLVNGLSIFYDTSITSYDYYHIETEDHSVISANGMLTESYLDTGNRQTFRQKGNVVLLGGNRNLAWNDDSAAPLVVARDVVEPLFRQIEARAQKAGVELHAEPPALTYDPDLRLVTEAGAIIHPARKEDDLVTFMIPSGVQSVHIVSNASRPCDVVGPFCDDRRYFGVAVGEISLAEARHSHTLTPHLTKAELEGWSSLDSGDTRWTAGRALLPLGERRAASVALLSLQIKAAGPYALTSAFGEKTFLQA